MKMSAHTLSWRWHHQRCRTDCPRTARRGSGYWRMTIEDWSYPHPHPQPKGFFLLNWMYLVSMMLDTMQRETHHNTLYRLHISLFQIINYIRRCLSVCLSHTLTTNENLLYSNKLLEGQVWFARYKRVFCSCAKPSHNLLITKEFNRWSCNVM